MQFINIVTLNNAKIIGILFLIVQSAWQLLLPIPRLFHWFPRHHSENNNYVVLNQTNLKNFNPGLHKHEAADQMQPSRYFCTTFHKNYVKCLQRKHDISACLLLKLKFKLQFMLRFLNLNCMRSGVFVFE